MTISRDAGLKKLSQLQEVRDLYDCRIRCLPAISYIVSTDTQDKEKMDSFFDKTRLCENMSIREFICEVLPTVGCNCVCADVEDKIRAMNVVLTKLE